MRLVEHRFVKKTKTCWLWTGSKIPKGYGRYSFRINGKHYCKAVHRLAYEQEIGPIPKGLHICHSCDVRNCVNPAHLWPGTHSENMLDAHRKGRGFSYHKGKTHCKNGHEFTKENTGRRTDHPGRVCLTCRRKRLAARALQGN